jgi:hypothetical protein
MHIEEPPQTQVVEADVESQESSVQLTLDNQKRSRNPWETLTITAVEGDVIAVKAYIDAVLRSWVDPDDMISPLRPAKIPTGNRRRTE